MKIRIRNILLFFLGLLLPMWAFCQMEQSKRIEFERTPMTTEFHRLIPLGTSGVVLINAQISYSNSEMDLTFIKYDTTLNEIWRQKYQQDAHHELLHMYDDGKYVFLLFREEYSLKFSILRVDMESGEKTLSEGVLPMDLSIEFFSVLKSQAYFGGKFNERPVVIFFSFLNNLTKVLPELHANQWVINNVEVNANTDNVYVMLKNERTCQFALKIYSYDGRLIVDNILGERRHNPIGGKILNVNDTKTLLVGSYANACSEYSEGIYLQSLEKNKFEYYDFANFKNFFKYLKPQKEAKVLKRNRLKELRGKEVKLYCRLLLHDLIPYQDGFLLIAEVFQPSYKSNPNTLLNSYSYHLSNQRYNAYQYSHAIICCFDNQGKLLWDDAFSLDYLESLELNEKTQLTHVNDGLLLAYPKEGIIKTEIIDGDKNRRPQKEFSLKVETPEESTADFNKTSLVSWYDRNFLAYGSEIVRKPKEIATKEVFVVSKLHYTIAATKE